MPRNSPIGTTVYLIHFDKPYKHARHYIGFTTQIADRMNTHVTAGTRSAKLMQVITAAGITWQIAKLWSDKTRAFERQLKKWHGAVKFCPLCKAAKQKIFEPELPIVKEFL